MKFSLNGIIPPMVTPLHPNGDLDLVGLKNLINHLIDGGVHGIFLLGTNGEGPSLSYEARKELITVACKEVNKRIPVLVGITDTSIEASLEIAQHASEVGADALVLAPPYYFPIDQSEMVDYLEHLAPQLPLPFVIYNMPSCTKLHLSIETVRKAKELGAIGIKDSSGNMSYLYDLITAFKDDEDFYIISGLELFLPETIMNGGHGAVAGGANFFPKLFVDLYHASLEGDMDKIALLREQVVKIYHTIYDVGKYSSKFTKGTKCALSVMGICNDDMAYPLRKFNPSERKMIKQYISEFNYSN